MKRMVLGLWTVAAVACLASGPAAAATKTFLETNQADFAAGESDGVVWTSLGTLRLGRALDTILDKTDGVDYVARLAEAPDGTLYAVTGGAGRIYRIRNDKADLYATLPDPFLFSCVADADGVLYVGSGGKRGRIWRIEPPADGHPKLQVLFEDDETRYVWDLALLPGGALAAATGDQGKLLRVTRDGKSEVLIDSPADHVLALAAAPDGTLYAGTDGEALVYRWADGKAFILFDAPEAEVTDLALDAAGNLYVGASSGGGGRRGDAAVTAGATITISGSAEVFESEGGDEGESFAAPPKEPEPAAEKSDAPADPPAEGADADEAAEAPESPPAEPETAAPTPVQSLAERLQEAMQAAQQAAGRAAGPGVAPAAGNRVYRITPDGLATPVFEGPEEMILALAAEDGRLLVATGRKGRVYEVALGGREEDACLATVDPKQAMALLVTRAGRVVVGTASPGCLYALSKGFAKEGTFTSQVHDVGGSARWGMMEWRAGAPDGTSVRIATRSGNVGDPEKGMWSEWSKESAKSPAAVASPAARYLQFRVTMQTRDDSTTPVLEQMEAAYLRANEPPKVLAVAEQPMEERGAQAQMMQRVRQMILQARGGGMEGNQPPPPAPAGPKPSQPVRLLAWQASDPNGDRLVYRVYFRGQGEPAWVLLANDLAQPPYPWDTSTVADGWYEVKVVASDLPDNDVASALEGEKVSDPILVDNTAPEFERVEVEVRGRDVTVRLVVRDATSWIAEAAYTLDSATEWTPIAPTDGLFDGPQKEFRFTLRDLADGPHRLAIRAGDQAGNTAHAARTLLPAP